MLHWKRNAALFLASQMFSMLGSSIAQQVMLFYVIQQTGQSPFAGLILAIGILCAFGPNLFVAPFGGVWADRRNRKAIIILSDGGIALVTLLLAIAFSQGFTSLWLLFAVAAIRSVGGAIQAPAVSAVLPSITPGAHLPRINGINSTMQAATMFVSMICAGPILEWFSVEAAFYLDVVTALIGIITLLFIRIPRHAKAAEKKKNAYFTDFFSGLRYIRNAPFLRYLFLFIAAFFFLAGPLAFLTALHVSQEATSFDLMNLLSGQTNSTILSAIEIALGIGLGAGGLLMATWGGFKNKLNTIITAAVVVGIGGILLDLIPSLLMRFAAPDGTLWLGLPPAVLIFYLIIAVFVGATIPLLNTSATVLLQQKTDENYLGRVFGVFNTLASVLLPVGMIPFGILSVFIPLPILLMIIGILFLLGSVAIHLNRPLRQGADPAHEHDIINASDVLAPDEIEP